MQIPSAASAVLNAAAPGAAVTGLRANAASPFAGLLENALRPSALTPGVPPASTTPPSTPHALSTPAGPAGLGPAASGNVLHGTPPSAFTDDPLSSSPIPTAGLDKAAARSPIISVANDDRSPYPTESPAGRATPTTPEAVGLTAGLNDIRRPSGSGTAVLGGAPVKPTASTAFAQTNQSTPSTPAPAQPSPQASKAGGASQRKAEPSPSAIPDQPVTFAAAIQLQTPAAPLNAASVQAEPNPSTAPSDLQAAPSVRSNTMHPEAVAASALSSTSAPVLSPMASGLRPQSAVPLMDGAPAATAVSASAPEDQTPPTVAATPTSAQAMVAQASVPTSASAQPLLISTMQAVSALGTGTGAATQAPSEPPPPPPASSSAVAQFTGQTRRGPATGAGSASTASRTQPGSLPPAKSSAGVVASDDEAFRVADAASADPQAHDPDSPVTAQDAPSVTVAPDAAQQAVLSPLAPASSSVDSAPARAVPQTVANLSAQIAQKVGGQTSRFDVQLDPLGLGRVNVSVEIDAKGAMSAALSFEKSEAANLLKSHAAELQQSLAQAGFNLADSALSFSTTASSAGGASGQNALLNGGAGGNGGQQSQGGQAQSASRSFGAAGLAADRADHIHATAKTLSARGLDIRI